MALTYTATALLVLAVTFAIGFALYNAIRPHPIPGRIPYTKASADHIFGDVPLAIKSGKETQQPLGFLPAKFEELNSPIAQVFLEPFGRPWVIVNDWRVNVRCVDIGLGTVAESYLRADDIMRRKTSEFDKSSIVSILMGALAPYSKVIGPANAEWHASRRRQSDTMSPSFINKVAAPTLHRHMGTCISILDELERLAQGRPIDLFHTLKLCLLDSIWSSTCGSDLGSLQAQKDFLSAYSSVELPQDQNEIVKIPSAPDPPTTAAMLALVDSIEISMANPTKLGRWMHEIALRFVPKLARATALTNGLIHDRLDAFWRKLESEGKDETQKLQCAADLIVQQEFQQTVKKGQARKPDSASELRDDALLFIHAGYETTDSTASWGVKYLVKHQDIQRALRASMRTAFPGESSPTSDMITKTRLPYMDAFIEEVLRHSGIITWNSRTAVVDTEIMGHFIPKGTAVYFNSLALLDPAQVSPSKRPGAHACLDASHFDPERWLVDNEQGQVEFDPQAAPMQTFSLGQRGCFGKRLAYVQLRIVFALLVWNFELLPTSTTQDFSAVDHLTHMPRLVHARLARVQKTW